MRQFVLTAPSFRCPFLSFFYSDSYPLRISSLSTSKVEGAMLKAYSPAH
jgi:hypothetical protein